ncbi:MAG: RDD family protein [Crocosphaera sp.]|nr:RDD family protein [Crocosphaera sp.]
MNYASFWSRFLAALLDGIIVNIISALAGFVMGLFLGILMGGNFSDGAASVLGFIIGIIVSWLYFALSHSSSKQATLGKQALGIVVTDLTGNRLSFGQATARYFSKWLSNLTLLIGYIMAAFTEKNQALHDIIAGTLVVKR